MPTINPTSPNTYEKLLFWLGEPKAAKRSMEQRCRQVVEEQVFIHLKNEYKPAKWTAAKTCLKLIKKNALESEQQAQIRTLFETKFPTVLFVHRQLQQLAQVHVPISKIRGIATAPTTAPFQGILLPRELWIHIFSFLPLPSQSKLFSTCRFMNNLKEAVWSSPAVLHEIIEINRAKSTWNHLPFKTLNDVHMFLTNDYIISMDPSRTLNILAIKSGKVLNTIPHLSDMAKGNGFISLSKCGNYLSVSGLSDYEIFYVPDLAKEVNPKPLVSGMEPRVNYTPLWCIREEMLLWVSPSKQILRKNLKSRGEEEVLIDWPNDPNFHLDSTIRFVLGGEFIVAFKEEPQGAHWWSLSGKKIAAVDAPTPPTKKPTKIVGRQIQMMDRAWNLDTGSEEAATKGGFTSSPNSYPQIDNFLAAKKKHNRNTCTIANRGDLVNTPFVSSPDRRWQAIRAQEYHPDLAMTETYVYIIDFGIGME